MSNFKWKDLIQLNSVNEAVNSPLSCLAHIDANAFFAQVEQIRCNYSRDDPVVCVQWRSIIAVSYAARKYNISRMDTIESAMEKCPGLIPIHTAVFKKGEDYWQYYDGYGSWNKDKNKQLSPELYKVSLDPYRRESRKIIKIFKEYCDLVEKASVDEVFLDLGRLCFQRLMLGDGEASTTIENNGIQDIDEHNTTSKVSILHEIRDLFITGRYNLDDYLPPIPENIEQNLDYVGDVYMEESSQMKKFEDWDDIIFALASQITDGIRKYIEETLGYTTSCGIARTKIICKLGSNFKKPNAQTIVLNRQVNNFLDCGKFEITSFWTLGGALGKQLISILHLPTKNSIKYTRENWSTPNELREYLVAEMKHTNFIPDHNKADFEKVEILTKKIFDLVRGQYCLALNPKPVVKSMMSNKNMRGKSCSNLVDMISWIEVFCGELTSRIRELEQEYNKIIIPKSISVFLRTVNGENYRKASSIIQKGSKVTSQDLLRAGTKLATELDSNFAKGKKNDFYPLNNLNMAISNFDILDLQKTVLDMFGGQAQVFKSNDEQESKNNNDNVDSSNDRMRTKESDFHCQQCNLDFDSNKEFQEHTDFHTALKLSESINGTTEDSKNLSIGEKRLLFSKKKKMSDVHKRLKVVKKTSNHGKNSRQNGDILKFFSK